MNCPYCTSDAVRPSSRNRSGELWKRLRGYKPYRCRTCAKRFLAGADGIGVPVKRGAEKSPEKARPAFRRLKRWLDKGGRGKVIQVAVFALVLLLFVVFLRYVSNDHSETATGQSKLEHIVPGLKELRA